MEKTNPAQQPERFETDTARIIHRHLANKDDVITEEDIANVRIGVSSPPDEALTDALEHAASEDTTEIEPSSDNPATPWDTVKE